MQQDGRITPRGFFLSNALPCPYVPGRIERRLLVELSGRNVERLHNGLSAAGFRRSHGIAYAPVCPGCDACQPMRVKARAFRPHRSFRRVLGRNADLRVEICEPVATEEQFRLFQAYQRARHKGGEMSRMDFLDYEALIEETPVPAFVIEARDPAGRLVAAGLCDRLEDGISAVYSFFDPAAADRSLGTFLILRTIDLARAEDRAHVYLGYWIAESPKMAYKQRFAPLEVFVAGRWVDLPPPSH